MVHLVGEEPQSFLGAFPIRDVPGDFRRPDDPAVRVPDRRDGDENFDQASVLAPSHGVVGLDALAAPDAFQDAGLFVLPIGRNEESDPLADDLVRRIAEDSLGGLVPAGDDAIDVVGHDRVVRPLDDRREFGVCRLRLLAPGDVVQTQESHARRPARQGERVCIERQGPTSELRPVVIDLEGLKGAIVGEHFLQLRRQTRQVQGSGAQRLERSPLDRVARDPEQRVEGPVGGQYAQVRAENDERIDDGVEGGFGVFTFVHGLVDARPEGGDIGERQHGPADSGVRVRGYPENERLVGDANVVLRRRAGADRLRAPSLEVLQAAQEGNRIWRAADVRRREA